MAKYHKLKAKKENKKSWKNLFKYEVWRAATTQLEEKHDLINLRTNRHVPLKYTFKTTCKGLEEKHSTWREFA